MLQNKYNDIISVLFMAFALGLDGFSVSLTIGLQQIRIKRVFFIGLVIGVFHIMLPFSGMIIGNFISLQLEFITSFFSSVILVFIGTYMFFSALQVKSDKVLNPYSVQTIFSVALLVSIDSFPVGLSVGLSGVKSFIVILLIGMIALVFSWTGMLIGKKTHKVLGVYSEMTGGIILFLYGLSGLF